MNGQLGSFSGTKAVINMFHGIHGASFLCGRFPITLICDRGADRAFSMHLGRPCSRDLGGLGRCVRRIRSAGTLRFVPVSAVLGRVCHGMCHFHGSM